MIELKNELSSGDQLRLEKKKLLDKEKKHNMLHIISDIENKIKNSEDWITFSINQIAKDNQINIPNSRLAFSEIMHNPNIMLKRTSTINGKIIPEKARPICYKWNNNVNNMSLLENSFEFYNITDQSSKDYLTDLIKRNNTINIKDLLNVYHLLYTDALDTWTETTIPAIANKLCMFINYVYDILNILYQNDKVLVKTRAKNKTFFALSCNKDKNTLINEFDNIENEILQSKNEILQPELEKPSSEEKSLIINSFSEKQPESSLNNLKENIIGFFAQQKKTVSDLFTEQSHKLQQTQTIVDKLIANNNEISAKCKEQQQEIEQLRLMNTSQAKELEALREYSFKFLSNATEVLETMLGEMSNMTDEFVSIPRHALNGNESSKFKGKLFKLVGDKSNEITKFKPESKFPKGEI